MLQSLRVTDACQEELPVIIQILHLLLQHAQLHNHMMANAVLLQQIVQEITRFLSTDAWEPRGPAAIREIYWSASPVGFEVVTKLATDS
ncbi:hypothetical protein AOXY_G4875 [Acipenser oxyrinchus oxyrinchus]|uniref:TEX10-like TPR repeats domain-containing protein n=1 Tax=Acipenser oxyrinchus oxyrinchus TaxID=40147 RepID=A0AAD8LQA6_ACIOX|nr:hypothetical protein AOXY_G4875 [Acipenser oxyrinchus oxyrinchus]